MPPGRWEGRWGFCSRLSHIGNPKRASVSPLIYSVGTGAGCDISSISRVSRALGTPCAGQDGANRPCGLAQVPSPAEPKTHQPPWLMPTYRTRPGSSPSAPSWGTQGRAACRAGSKPTALREGDKVLGGLCVWIWGSTHVLVCPTWLGWGVHACAFVCVHMGALV